MQQKLPKLRFQFQFFSFLTFAGTFSHIIHRFKDFRPFHSLRTQSLSGNHGTGQENRDGTTRREGCLDTTLISIIVLTQRQTSHRNVFQVYQAVSFRLRSI